MRADGPMSIMKHQGDGRPMYKHLYVEKVGWREVHVSIISPFHNPKCDTNTETAFEIIQDIWEAVDDKMHIQEPESKPICLN